MSRSKTETIECPECGKSQEATIWESVNPSLDPALREELFACKLNVHTCVGCEATVFFNEPLLYHDMDRGFAVQYYPPEFLDVEGFIAQFEPDNPPRMRGVSEEMGYLAQPHIVFSMDGLLACIIFHEKIRGG
jgi:hypothetical protein